MTEPDPFETWVASRPPKIQEMIRKYPPRTPYRLNDDDDEYYIYSYSEDGTVTLTRVCDGVPLWNVFGVDPAGLTPA